MTKKPSPEFLEISKAVGRAIGDYHMLEDGDRVLVAVSGGKDSLCLLNILLYRQTFIPVKVKLKAVFIDTDLPKFSLKRLVAYFKSLGIDYHITKSRFRLASDTEDNNCFWCSWNRRKALFELAQKLGYNKIAFGHHRDDIAVTILLNLFYRAEIGAMKPAQKFFSGKVTAIRPLAYVSEKAIAALARRERYPRFDRVPCPLSRSSKRKAIQQILDKLERENPSIKLNIFRSLTNVKYDYLLEGAP